MEFPELISRLALALGIGLLFGLERGWRTREERAGKRTAGIRTFAITGVLGGVVGALAQALGGIGGGLVLGMSVLIYGAGMALFCREENRADGTFSATTWVAAMLALALSIYAVIGDLRSAAALAVGSTIILALREPLHGWVERITWPEFRSGLVLLAMTFIALPIVPDDPIGPFGGVNPREVWLIAIVLAGVSFVGYTAVKYFGTSRGLLLAGLAGGLASSTAVTIANARRSVSREGAPPLLAAGVAVANSVMLLRMGSIVLAINPRLLFLLAPPLLAAAVVAVLYALVTVRWRDTSSPPGQEQEFRNPFAFWPVVGFAIFLGLVIVLGRALGEWLGATGAIAGAAVIGFVDVDAITVSLSRLPPDMLSPRDATIAILAAGATGTLGKVLIGLGLAPGRFAGEVAIMALGCLAAGVAAAIGTFALVTP